MVERSLRKPGRKETTKWEGEHEKLSARDNSLNLELDPGKVQKESVFQPGRPQLRAHNCKMHILEGFDCLKIDDHLALHQDIEAMHSYLEPIVLNRNCFLLLDVKAALAQFGDQRVFIDRFKKAGTKFSMNFDASPNYHFSQIAKFQRHEIPFSLSWLLFFLVSLEILFRFPTGSARPLPAFFFPGFPGGLYRGRSHTFQ
jgi:hypothetical protein